MIGQLNVRILLVLEVNRNRSLGSKKSSRVIQDEAWSHMKSKNENLLRSAPNVTFSLFLHTNELV